MDSTWCYRMRAVSAVDLSGREPHWRGWMREQVVAWAERREVTTLSRLLESMRRRTMTLKEEGES